MSGIGKGVTTASIGRILKNYGFRVSAVKIDPYLNVDAGTMNPIEHGEVFVTSDGVECDQDIGNYERFLDQEIPRENYLTSGLIYKTVIEQERNLEFEGKCVEIIPHIPSEVMRRLDQAAHKSQADFLLVEIGGTVGEYQNLIFLETARILRIQRPKHVLFLLVSYVPIPEMIGEMKTKPTQHAVRLLNSAGLQPDIIIARSKQAIDAPRKRKIALFCNVSEEDVISAPDIASIYEVPSNFEKDKLDEKILKKFNIKKPNKKDSSFHFLVKKIRKVLDKDVKKVRIGVIGKYFETGDFILADSYISVIEAVRQAAFSLGIKPEIDWLNAEKYEKNSRELNELKKYHGVIVPGGFGSRGVEGKILAINFIRKNKIPFLGLCYGLQLAVVEFARNMCDLKGAHTSEVEPKTKFPVIDTMPEQLVNMREKKMGGSMRLGAYQCRIKQGTLARRIYKTSFIQERHRHRYELNNYFRDALEEKGLIISGINQERNLAEIIELKNHPFFIAVQFHPEFQSRPLNPHPLFKALIQKAALFSK